VADVGTARLEITILVHDLEAEETWEILVTVQAALGAEVIVLVVVVFVLVVVVLVLVVLVLVLVVLVLVLVVVVLALVLVVVVVASTLGTHYLN
jgi:hypothetical protein